MARESKKKKQDEAPAEQVELALAPSDKKLVMKTNVLYNNVFFAKGSEVPAEHAEFFIKSEYVTEV